MQENARQFFISRCLCYSWPATCIHQSCIWLLARSLNLRSIINVRTAAAVFVLYLRWLSDTAIAHIHCRRCCERFRARAWGKFQNFNASFSSSAITEQNELPLHMNHLEIKLEKSSGLGFPQPNPKITLRRNAFGCEWSDETLMFNDTYG